MNRNGLSFALLLLLIGCNSPTDIPTQVIQTKVADATQVLTTPTPIPQSPTPGQTATATSPPFLPAFPDFPTGSLIDRLPSECPGVGHQAYAEPSVASVATFQEDEFSMVLGRGIHFIVTSDSDEVDGDTDNRDALNRNPGTDGISLREALLVTNHSPGEYTIQFDPSLKGTTIQVGSWEGRELPPLEGGSVIINGDIDGDQQPDITLENNIGVLTEANSIFGLRIHSSHNTLFGLAFSGFTAAVFFDAPSTHQVYADNTVSHLSVEGESGIVLYSGQGSDDVPVVASHNRWENTRVTGNTIVAHNGSGVSFSMHRAAMDRVAQLVIVGNHIRVVNEFERGAGSGVDLSPGFGSGSDGNRVEHVLIQGNTIEGNPATAISLASGSMSGESNVIRNVHILENTIRESYTYAEYMHTFGIAISAGFWVNQEGNEISNVAVVGNSLEGNPEISVLVASGSVGSSKNLIERVYFHDNHIRITQPAREDGIPVMAMGITTGDGATDYYDPSHQPVVYPNDNILRDVWISGNLIEGQGGYGIMVSTGDPGVERNHLERVYINGNELRQFFPDTGILVAAISLEHGGSGDNRISEVFIQQNSIRYTNLRAAFGGEEFASGGIVLSAGNGASRNLTEDIWIVANDISSPAPGINLAAGWAQPQFPPSIGNTIRYVRLWCNTVAENPTLLEPVFPGIRGINLAGGWGLAQDNRVESLDIAKNLVAGIEDDISVFDNAGEGSRENSVQIHE
jgi:hypothetical protein